MSAARPAPAAAGLAVYGGLLAAAWLFAGAAHAQESPSTLTAETGVPASAEPPAPPVPLLAPVDAACARCEGDPSNLFRNLRRDLDYFTLVSERPGLSFHKPMFLLPVTYSDEIPNKNIEVLFQISLKQRLFGRNFFFGYTQKSFWQLYDGDNSRPFRETNYNPELFYRYKPHWSSLPALGFDVGGEHESNGQDLPNSRSWNRVVFSTFWEQPAYLVYLKTWWRIPEEERQTPDDPEGDDNPDIEEYYGYTELHLQGKFFGSTRQHMTQLMLRGNPATGKFGMNLVYSAPLAEHTFWNLYLWHGHGENLMDYRDAITRVGVGIMLAR